MQAIALCKTIPLRPIKPRWTLNHFKWDKPNPISILHIRSPEHKAHRSGGRRLHARAPCKHFQDLCLVNCTLNSFLSPWGPLFCRPPAGQGLAPMISLFTCHSGKTLIPPSAAEFCSALSTWAFLNRLSPGVLQFLLTLLCSIALPNVWYSLLLCKFKYYNNQAFINHWVVAKNCVMQVQTMIFYWTWDILKKTKSINI